jgi:hypothetical protein
MSIDTITYEQWLYMGKPSISALFVDSTDEQELESNYSIEFEDSNGLNFIDVDDKVRDHRTVNGYVTVDDELPIYNSEPQDEVSDTRTKDSWSSISDRFSVHDVMNMHYVDSITFGSSTILTRDPIEPIVEVPTFDIGYKYQRVMFHDSVYLLYSNQVNSARAAELRKSWLENIKDYKSPYVNANGVAIGSHKVSQDIAEKWGLVVA